MMLRVSRVASVLVTGLAFSAAGACGEDRSTFNPPPPPLVPVEDADAGVDEAPCDDRCSLDGRSVVRCTGELVETCPTELACGGGECKTQCAAAAALGSSNGCEFYLQPPFLMSMTAHSHSCYASYIVNTSTIPVEIELEYQGKAVDISQSMSRTVPGEATLVPHTGPIAPGDAVILFVSDRPTRPDRPTSEGGHTACPTGTTAAMYHDYYPKGTQLGSSFRLKTTAPVSAAAIYPFGGAPSVAPSATLLLPVATWSKENILINAWSAGKTAPPGVQIVASEDGTDVTIIPKNDIQDGLGVVGSPAGVPATYRLERGQFLQLVQQQELTGSFVTSTKPTSVFAAHVAMDIPADVGTADLEGTQIAPYEQWGSEYVGVGYRPRLHDDELEPMPYRIVAVRDGTRLDYDPVVPRGAPIELNAGEVATFAAGVGVPFVVRTQDAEHPIHVAQYMSGQMGDYWGSGRNFVGMGDPEFVNVVAAGQYLTSASFYADPTYAETSLVIVRAKTDGVFKDVTLDCLGGPVPNFRPVGTRGTYEWTRVDLSKDGRPGTTAGDKSCYYGVHHLRSEGAFTATLWGWDRAASYAYPSGQATRRLVRSPLITK